MAKERADDEAPQVILELLELPYIATSNGFFGRGTKMLDVGGGERRLGNLLYGADDIDVDAFLKNKFTGSMLELPFEDNSYDIVTCFEAIEHVDKPLLALSELVRVAKKTLVVGSVNSAGQNFLDGNIAIWKGKDNEFHLSEMDNEAFKQLFSGLNVQFMSSVYTLWPRKEFALVNGNSKDAIANYAIVTI